MPSQLCPDMGYYDTCPQRTRVAFGVHSNVPPKTNVDMVLDIHVKPLVEINHIRRFVEQRLTTKV